MKTMTEARAAGVYRRTFEALKHAKGSGERERLNRDAVTSEYMPSYRYVVVTGQGNRTFHTKRAASEHWEAVRGDDDGR